MGALYYASVSLSTHVSTNSYTTRIVVAILVVVAARRRKTK